MIERKIDNRGSKSKDEGKTTLFVKEQRVDGSWQEKYNTLLLSRCFHSCLRYILMDLEINCQIKILSKLSSIKKKDEQLIYTKAQANYSLTIISLSERQSLIFYKFSLKLRGYRSYSTKKGTIPPHLVRSSSQGDSMLDPNWVTGFVDGEGCFSVLIVQKNKLKVGWEVKPRFQLELHKRDIGVIEDIKNFFAAGKISKYRPDAVQLRFESRKDLASVYLHFKKFKLITIKNADFELCCEVQDIIERGGTSNTIWFT